MSLGVQKVSKNNFAKITLVALCTSGCAYKADPTSAPARNVVTSYSNKIPGRWAVLVEAERLNTTVRSQDIKCSAHTFPIDFTKGFPASVRETLPNVIAQVDFTEESSVPDAMKSTKSRGLIQIRGEQLEARLKIVPGFWTANVIVEVDMTVAVTVDGGGGRLFGKTFDGHGHADRPAGMFCGGGADAVKAAAEDAQRNVLRRIAEDLANSDRVRSGRGS